MTSVSKYSRIQVLLLSLMSSMAFPSNALAQPTIAGTFTLSSEARWGPVVLPAGEYAYGVEDNGSSPLVIIFSSRGAGKGFVFPTSISEMGDSDKGKISLEKDGELVVTSVCVEKLGLVFHYAAHTTTAETVKKTLPQRQIDSYTAAK
jgi:hypothetical protein